MTDLTDRLSTALAGRYRLERELGRGGMATVFLAQDLKPHHHRRVAIKVLHPELTALLGPERFLREIEISARLQHPHILTLLDSGEAQGLLYYVMLYEGESLRERLEREKQLPVDEALRLAGEVGDALDHAHRAGVVHRDIKPENILLQAGHAVVADFGIARAVSAAGGTKLTAPDAPIGTPAYMSPEQWMPSGDLDGRSDQYSLGCVVYEMLAGVPPFASKDSASLNYQHLSVTPPPVTSVRPSVPGATASAIARSLAKTPADRFGTAGEFVAALRAPAPVPTVVDPPLPRRVHWRALVAGAVAIVALAYVAWRTIHHPSPVPGKKDWILVAEFDGPAADSSVVAATRDLVSAALDQSEIVATVPRDQIRLALQSAGKPTSTRVDAEMAREIAYRSAVRTVLEGQVGRLGKGYSLVLRLVDADSARVVLSVSDAAADEKALIPTVGRIAKKLRARLGEQRSAIQATRELATSITPSFEAYKALTKGRERLFGMDNRAAIVWFREALAQDPDCTGAWAGLGYAFGNLSELDSALAAFREAQARPDRHTDRSRLFCAIAISSYTEDITATLALSDQQVLLYPEVGAAHNNRSSYLRTAGRFREALESARTAEKVSPFGASQQTLGNQFSSLIMLGRVDEARTLASRLRGTFALEAPMVIAAAGGQWSAAESLAIVLRSTSAADNDLRRTAATILAAVQASRGQVRAADQTLRQAQSVAETTHEPTRANWTRWDRLRLALFSRGVAADPGTPGNWDSTTAGLVVRGAWAAAAGESEQSRRLLATIRRRSEPDLARQGFFGPTMVEAWLAARAGQWQDVVPRLGPAALQGEATRDVTTQSAPLIRWLVAEAYDQLGRPDSAAAYFERAIASPPEGGTDLAQVRAASSFAHRRLVLLYARMGRLEEARRHWQAFSATFTRPDPELLPLVEEARAALASAEAMAGGQRR